MSDMPRPTHDSPAAERARLRHSGAGWCGRCGMPWGTVAPHVTQYEEHSGCFPLCGDCWRLLGHPEARIPYYGALMEAWAAHYSEERIAEVRRGLTEAVAAGL